MKTLLECAGGGILLLLLVPGRGRDEDEYMNYVVMGVRGQLLIGGGDRWVGGGGGSGKAIHFSRSAPLRPGCSWGGGEGEQAQSGGESIRDQISAKAVEAR